MTLRAHFIKAIFRTAGNKLFLFSRTSATGMGLLLLIFVCPIAQSRADGSPPEAPALLSEYEPESKLEIQQQKASAKRTLIRDLEAERRHRVFEILRSIDWQESPASDPSSLARLLQSHLFYDHVPDPALSDDEKAVPRYRDPRTLIVDEAIGTLLARDRRPFYLPRNIALNPHVLRLKRRLRPELRDHLNPARDSAYNRAIRYFAYTLVDQMVVQISTGVETIIFNIAHEKADGLKDVLMNLGEFGGDQFAEHLINQIVSTIVSPIKLPERIPGALSYSDFVSAYSGILARIVDVQLRKVISAMAGDITGRAVFSLVHRQDVKNSASWIVNGLTSQIMERFNLPQAIMRGIFKQVHECIKSRFNSSARLVSNGLGKYIVLPKFMEYLPEHLANRVAQDIVTHNPEVEVIKKSIQRLSGLIGKGWGAVLAETVGRYSIRRLLTGHSEGVAYLVREQLSSWREAGFGLSDPEYIEGIEYEENLSIQRRQGLGDVKEVSLQRGEVKKRRDAFERYQSHLSPDDGGWNLYPLLENLGWKVGTVGRGVFAALGAAPGVLYQSYSTARSITRTAFRLINDTAVEPLDYQAQRTIRPSMVYEIAENLGNRSSDIFLYSVQKVLSKYGNVLVSYKEKNKFTAGEWVTWAPIQVCRSLSNPFVRRGPEVIKDTQQICDAENTIRQWVVKYNQLPSDPKSLENPEILKKRQETLAALDQARSERGFLKLRLDLLPLMARLQKPGALESMTQDELAQVVSRLSSILAIHFRTSYNPLLIALKDWIEAGEVKPAAQDRFNLAEAQILDWLNQLRSSP